MVFVIFLEGQEQIWGVCLPAPRGYVPDVASCVRMYAAVVICETLLSTLSHCWNSESELVMGPVASHLEDSIELGQFTG